MGSPLYTENHPITTAHAWLLGTEVGGDVPVALASPLSALAMIEPYLAAPGW